MASNLEKHLWNGQRYHSLNYHLQQIYGEKVYKLAIDGGFTCPNRDGTLGERGCIFCSAGGSGDFAASRTLSITEQIAAGKELLKNKNTGHKYIAYFQAFTNTYAPVERLRKLYLEAMAHPDIAGIAIGTRPDCLGDDVLDLLNELNHIKPIMVELGLQTIHEKTAEFIRRGYPLKTFRNCSAKSSLYWYRSGSAYDSRTSGGIRSGYAGNCKLSGGTKNRRYQATAFTCATAYRSGKLIMKKHIFIF